MCPGTKGWKRLNVTGPPIEDFNTQVNNISFVFQSQHSSIYKWWSPWGKINIPQTLKMMPLKHLGVKVGSQWAISFSCLQNKLTVVRLPPGRTLKLGLWSESAPRDFKPVFCFVLFSGCFIRAGQHLSEHEMQGARLSHSQAKENRLLLCPKQWKV